MSPLPAMSVSDIPAPAQDLLNRILAPRIIIDALLPSLCAAFAIRSFRPPSYASKEAQARASSDPFARFGLVKFPPILVPALYLVALLWHLRIAYGDVLERAGLGHWALPSLERGQLVQETAAWVLAGLGGALRYWCYRTLRHFFTFSLAVLDDHRIVSTGPYAVVRHPSYTGLFLVTSGLTLLMQSLPVPLIGSCPPLRAACVYAFCAYMIWTRIGDEEAMMVREFAAIHAKRQRQLASARRLVLKQQQDKEGNHSRQNSIESVVSVASSSATRIGDAPSPLLKAVLCHDNKPTQEAAHATKDYGAINGPTRADEGDVEAGLTSDDDLAGDFRRELSDSDHSAAYDYEAYRRKVPYKLIPFVL